MLTTRRIIDGKLYDTNTATKIIIMVDSHPDYDQHPHPEELGEVEVGLFLSPRGQFFLVTEFGDEPDAPPNSIALLSRDEAYSWLEEMGAPYSAYQLAGFHVEEG